MTPEQIRADIFVPPPPEDPIDKVYGVNIKKASVPDIGARLKMDREQAIALATNILKAAEARKEIVVSLRLVKRRRVIVYAQDADPLASRSPEPQPVAEDSANMIRVESFKARVNRK
jgi:hypothetical protein